MTAARALDFFFREGPTVFFTATPEFPWRVLSISENVESLLGYGVEEILANPNFFWDVIHEDDRTRGREVAQTLRAMGRSSHLCRMRKADGSYSLAQGEFCLLRNAEGAPETIVGYWTDQTDRERSRAILSAIPDAIFEVNRDGEFTFFQARVDKTFDTNQTYDTDPEHIVGSTLKDILPADVADLLANAARRALLTQEPQTVKYALPFGREWKHYQANFGTSLNHESAIAIVRDITDEVLHEQALSEQKRYLEEANASLEQFVYVASHDLREPLIGVAGYATLLQRRYSSALDEQGSHWVDGIVSGTKNMEAKIDDLLTLSRVNRGNNAGTFPLGLAIEGAKRSLVGPLKSCEVCFHLPDVLPMVRGDRGQVTQLFQNLFSNSIKYRKADQVVSIQVSVDQGPVPGTLLIAVRDNGIGFDPKHAERIFGVFQRLYTVQQYPGTGIGLAIVKKIVERHGGKVWAASEPGQGATFFFTLPVAS